MKCEVCHGPEAFAVLHLDGAFVAVCSHGCSLRYHQEHVVAMMRRCRLGPQITWTVHR